MEKILELILKVFLSSVVYPVVLELVRRRELDPAFKMESDRIYTDLQKATTTAERKAASRKLYELQKS